MAPDNEADTSDSLSNWAGCYFEQYSKAGYYGPKEQKGSVPPGISLQSYLS